MTKFKKILFIVVIALLVITGALYIDFFFCKHRETHPRIAIKENINDNEVVYKAVFYKVWYCKTTKKYTLGGWGDVDAICPSDYEYEDGVYTNLALLLSDQNPFSIKIAAYQTTGKEHFLDRKEFTGSVIETYDKLIDYLKLNSATYGIVETTNRVDIEEYPEFIIREIALNSIIHRDYSTLTSNIINIYKDNEIEFISYGALYGNITVDDILNGLSTTRNPYLQSIFMRLNEVEAIGSGLKRVNEFYKSKGLKLQINALPSSFIVKLPRIDLTFPKANDDEQKIYNYIQNTGYITRKEAETLLGKERTATTKILNKMIQNGTIKKTGNSTSVRYEIKEWF